MFSLRFCASWSVDSMRPAFFVRAARMAARSFDGVVVFDMGSGGGVGSGIDASGVAASTDGDGRAARHRRHSPWRLRYPSAVRTRSTRSLTTSESAS